MDSNITKYFKVIKPNKSLMSSEHQNSNLSKTDLLLIDNLVKKNVILITIYNYKYLTTFSKNQIFSKINSLADKFCTVSKGYLLKFVDISPIELDSHFFIGSQDKKKDDE